MRRFANLILMAGLYCAVGTGVRGAYLESDAGGSELPVRPEPPGRIIPPPRPDRHPLRDLVRRIRIGPAYMRHGLAFFPLLLGDERGELDALTLDEAVSRRLLVVEEQDSPRVPELRVRNDAHRPVFLMAGEILMGGKQNRIVRDDVLLPARSGAVDIPVYCGEQARWTEGSSFGGVGGLAAPSLRRMAAESAAQDRIWAEIDDHLKQARVESGSRNYQQLYEDEAFRRRLDDCVAGFRDFCRPRTVGCVAVWRGRIQGCDVFEDAGLFARLWDKICRSYAAPYVLPGDWPVPEPIPDPIRPVPLNQDGRRPSEWPEAGEADVRRFLDGVLSAGLRARHTPGMGTYWAVDGPVAGNVLEHRGRVVHAGLFGDRLEVVPMK